MRLRELNEKFKEYLPLTEIQKENFIKQFIGIEIEILGDIIEIGYFIELSTNTIIGSEDFYEKDFNYQSYFQIIHYKLNLGNETLKKELLYFSRYDRVFIKSKILKYELTYYSRPIFELELLSIDLVTKSSENIIIRQKELKEKEIILKEEERLLKEKEILLKKENEKEIWYNNLNKTKVSIENKKKDLQEILKPNNSEIKDLKIIEFWYKIVNENNKLDTKVRLMTEMFYDDSYMFGKFFLSIGPFYLSGSQILANNLFLAFKKDGKGFSYFVCRDRDLIFERNKEREKFKRYIMLNCFRIEYDLDFKEFHAFIPKVYEENPDCIYSEDGFGKKCEDYWYKLENESDIQILLRNVILEYPLSKGLKNIKYKKKFLFF